MANEDIRSALKNANLKHWQLAHLLQISEATLVRKLRQELPTKEKEKIFKIVKKFEQKGGVK